MAKSIYIRNKEALLKKYCEKFNAKQHKQHNGEIRNGSPADKRGAKG
jgi:hypothetical protein